MTLGKSKDDIRISWDRKILIEVFASGTGLGGIIVTILNPDPKTQKMNKEVTYYRK